MRAPFRAQEGRTRTEKRRIVSVGGEVPPFRPVFYDLTFQVSVVSALVPGPFSPDGSGCARDENSDSYFYRSESVVRVRLRAQPAAAAAYGGRPTPVLCRTSPDCPPSQLVSTPTKSQSRQGSWDEEKGWIRAGRGRLALRSTQPSAPCVPPPFACLAGLVSRLAGYLWLGGRLGFTGGARLRR